MMGPRIFISHASQDQAFAERLADDLRRAGADVWLDATHLGTGNFLQRINEAINARDVLLLILTPDAIADRSVPFEMDTAIVRYKQGLMQSPIIVMAKPVSLRDIPALWTGYNRIDATADYDKALHGVIRVLGLAFPTRAQSQLLSAQPTPSNDSKLSSAIGDASSAHRPDSALISRRSLLMGAGGLTLAAVGVGVVAKLAAALDANKNSSRGNLPGATPSPTAMSGSLKWRFDTGFQVANSVALMDGVVYVGTDQGMVYAIDASTGAKRWSSQATASKDQRCTGPTVENGIVYVGGSEGVGAGEGFIYALDGATGAPRWHYKVGDDVGVPLVAGGTVYLGSFDGHVYAFNAETGTLQWKYAADLPFGTLPAIVGNTVYVNSTSLEKANQLVIALDADTGSKKWSFEVNASVMTSPTAASTIVCFCSESGVFALNATTGALQWKKDLGSTPSSGPAVAGGVVCVYDSNGNVNALDFGSGNLSWQTQVDQPQNGVDVVMCWSPIIANGQIYLGTLHHIYSVRTDNGTVQWNYPTNASTASYTPVIQGRTLFTSSQDGVVYAIYI